MAKVSSEDLNVLVDVRDDLCISQDPRSGRRCPRASDSAVRTPRPAAPIPRPAQRARGFSPRTDARPFSVRDRNDGLLTTVATFKAPFPGGRAFGRHVRGRTGWSDCPRSRPARSRHGRTPSGISPPHQGRHVWVRPGQERPRLVALMMLASSPKRSPTRAPPDRRMRSCGRVRAEPWFRWKEGPRLRSRSGAHLSKRLPGPVPTGCRRAQRR